MLGFIQTISSEDYLLQHRLLAAAAVTETDAQSQPELCLPPAPARQQKHAVSCHGCLWLRQLEEQETAFSGSPPRTPPLLAAIRVELHKNFNKLPKVRHGACEATTRLKEAEEKLREEHPGIGFSKLPKPTTIDAHMKGALGCLMDSVRAYKKQKA